MVISDRYRYLYFVIPKCGSATVRHALAPYTDIGYPVSNFEEHVTIEKFRGKYDADGRFDRSFKFTFVRNPYDRLYSGYRQDMLASKSWKNWIAAKKPLFDALGDDFNAYVQKYVAKADIVHAWDWICFCPMTAFSHVDGQCVLDWIGRTESLEADLRTLGTRLGVEIGEVGRINAQAPDNADPADAGGYLSKYTRATVEIVNELYADDFAAFGYPVRDPDDFPVSL